MSRDFPVTGGKEIAATLTALGKRIESQAIRSGLTAAAAVVRDEARMLAPKKTGKMAKAIKTGSPRKNQDGSYSVTVRLSGEHEFLGLFMEYGAKPHLISAGDSKYTVRTLNRRIGKYGSEQRDNGLLKIFGGEYTRTVHTKNGDREDVLVIDKHFVGGAVQHPGISPRPFLRPALDAKTPEAIDAFRNKIVAVVEKKTGYNIDAGLDEGE